MVPEVSVLMAVHDGGPFLAPALESVLAQDLPDLELIVVDDGSRDGSWDVIQDYARRDRRVVPLRNSQQRGLPVSLNRALARARGRFLARQDADDISLPGRLRAQVEFLHRHRQVVLLGTAVIPVDRDNRVLGPAQVQPARDRIIRWKMLLFNAFFHPTVMLRRRGLERAGGGYDPKLAYAQDYELWSRLLRVGRGANLARPLVRQRLHPGQGSRTAWETQQRLADRTAWDNFARAGLAGVFSPEEISLMRRAGFSQARLDADQRRRQLRCLRRFFRLVRRRLGGRDPQWLAEERRVWQGLRRASLHQPRDLALLQVMAWLLILDPGGFLADLGLWLRRG